VSTSLFVQQEFRRESTCL